MGSWGSRRAFSGWGFSRRGSFPGLVGFGGLAVLLLHVFNLYGEQLAILQSSLQRVTGIFRVHVGFDDFVVIYHHHAVADGFQEQPQFQRILLDLRVAAHDEFGAVGEVDLTVKLCRHIAEEFGGFLGFFLFREAALQHNAAAEHAEHPLEDQAQALAASIHHAGLFQHGQQVGGILQGVGSAHAYGVPHLDGVTAHFQGFPAPLGSHPGHGEDGALSGLHHGLVGFLNAQFQGGDQVLRGNFLPAFQALGNAPEQQGQNDAGIAPGSPQHGGSSLFSHLGSGGGVV